MVCAALALVPTFVSAQSSEYCTDSDGGTAFDKAGVVKFLYPNTSGCYLHYDATPRYAVDSCYFDPVDGPTIRENFCSTKEESINCQGGSAGQTSRVNIGSVTRSLDTVGGANKIGTDKLRPGTCIRETVNKFGLTFKDVGRWSEELPTTGRVQVLLKRDGLVDDEVRAQVKIDGEEFQEKTEAVFENLSFGPHTVTVTNLPDATETFTTCSYNRNEPACRRADESQYDARGISCVDAVCTIPIEVVVGRVSKVIVRYGGAPAGQLSVFRVGSEDTPSSAPAGATVNIDAGEDVTRNAAVPTTRVSVGAHTVYAKKLAGFMVTAGVKQCNGLTTDASCRPISNFNYSIDCTTDANYCSVSGVNVVNNKLTRVVFKYVASSNGTPTGNQGGEFPPGNSGGSNLPPGQTDGQTGGTTSNESGPRVPLRVRRVGHDLTHATVPAGTSASVDGGERKTNCTAASDLCTSSFLVDSTKEHIVEVTDLAGYTETVGTCTFTLGANNCSVTLLGLNPQCNGTTCSIRVGPYASGMGIKVAVKYTREGGAQLQGLDEPTSGISNNPPTANTGSNTPTVILKINNQDAARIQSGTSGIFTWTTTNASSCTALALPTDLSWTGPKPTLSPVNGVNITVTPGTTYTLTCVNSAGTSVTDSVVVSLPNTETPVLNFTGFKDGNLTQQSSSITVPVGGIVSLTWSGNVTSCTAEGGWATATSGTGLVQINTATPGTHTYRLTCTKGLESVSKTVTVTVTGMQSQTPTITVLSPNGGETFTLGNYMPISFTISGVLPVGTPYTVELFGQNNQGVPIVTGTVVAADVQRTRVALPLPTGSSTFLIGSHKIRVFYSVGNTIVQDQSDNNFTITAQNTPASTITVLSPNGGETFNIGGTMNIRFESVGMTGLAYVGLFRGNEFVRDITNFSSPQDFIGNKEYNWLIPSDLATGNNYRIHVIKPGGSGTVGQDKVDFSDSHFTIASSITPTAPTVDLKANNTDGTITVSQNTPVTLSWTSTNATSCTSAVNWAGPRALSGSYILPSTGSITTYSYQLTCYNSAGQSATDRVTVTIQNTTTIANTVDLKITGQGISYESGTYYRDGTITVPFGTNISLSWTSTGASSCTASGGWSGSKNLVNTVGETIGPITGARTFTIVCGGVSDSVTVQVSGSTTADAKANGVDGEVTINSGQSAVLQWGSTNASSCYATGSWTGTRDVTPNVLSLLTVPNLAVGTYTFVLTCSGASQISDIVVVRVVQPVALTGVNIYANNTKSGITVNSGANATLSWSAPGATSCNAFASPATPMWTGAKEASGSVQVGPITSTIGFYVSCTNGSTTIQDGVSVQVVSPNNPAIDLKVNGSSGPITVPVGSTVTVTWNVTNATVCVASSLSSNWSGEKSLSGSQTISTSGMTQSYFTPSLTCYNEGATPTTSASREVRVNFGTTASNGTADTAAILDGLRILLQSITGGM